MLFCTVEGAKSKEASRIFQQHSFYQIYEVPASLKRILATQEEQVDIWFVLLGFLSSKDREEVPA